MKYRYFPLLVMGLLLFGANFLSAIPVDAAPLSSAEALQERVNALWQAKQENDWEKVYGMSDQKFRKTVTQKKFLQGRSMVINGYSISTVEVDPDSQLKGASLVIFKTIKFAMPFEISIKDEWVNEDGVWNVKLSDPRTPFDTMTQ
ncbi:MAG: hypothetical protein KJ950_01020 [Proteobacteria bacterium]|nr:hypothetical protein [Pseudomonadota bacterium]MBU1686238.1 hypothetical protein [Pseudomonadota bacterium]